MLASCWYSQLSFQVSVRAIRLCRYSIWNQTVPTERTSLPPCQDPSVNRIGVYCFDHDFFEVSSDRDRQRSRSEGLKILGRYEVWGRKVVYSRIPFDNSWEKQPWLSTAQTIILTDLRIFLWRHTVESQDMTSIFESVFHRSAFSGIPAWCRPEKTQTGQFSPKLNWHPLRDGKPYSFPYKLRTHTGCIQRHSKYIHPGASWNDKGKCCERQLTFDAM